GSDAFHLTDVSTVDVPFMTQEHGFAYAETDHEQVIDLPYNADSFNLTIILPHEGQFDAVEKALDADTWQSMIDALTQSITQLSLPTFAFDTAASMVSALQSLGITDAFDAHEADFSGMIDEDADDETADGLVISNVLHKSFISVDENGTEAAAATAVDGDDSATPAPDGQVTMQVDRPFLFAIRDAAMSTVLFLGRVMNPVDAEG